MPAIWLKKVKALAPMIECPPAFVTKTFLEFAQPSKVELNVKAEAANVTNCVLTVHFDVFTQDGDAIIYAITKYLEKTPNPAYSV